MEVSDSDGDAPAPSSSTRAEEKRYPTGGYYVLSQEPKQVTNLTHAGFVGFRAMNVPDAFARDDIAVESSFDNGEVDVTDLFAGIMNNDDEGETGVRLHPGYVFGVATLAVQSARDAKIHGKFTPATMVTPAPLQASRFNLTYIHVLGAWPLGTDPRLWYVHSCSVRKASPSIVRKRFMPNNIAGECFVMVSLPGSAYGSPVIRPRVLAPSHIESVCGDWGGGPVLAEALEQARLYADRLEEKVATIVEEDEAYSVGLCVNGLWAWAAHHETTTVGGDTDDLYKHLLAFCEVDVKREQMRVLRYEKAWSRSDDHSAVSALQPDFVQDPGQAVLMDAVGVSTGVVPPYFDFVGCSKSPTKEAHIAIRANQLRVWLLSGYVIGMQPVFTTVVPCNSIRPPPEVAEGKARVCVPSRFLMGLGLSELRFLWALLYAPQMLADAISEASGDAGVLAKLPIHDLHDKRPLHAIYPELIPLDTKAALELASGDRADLPPALQVRNVLYALWKLSCGDREPDVLSEMAHLRDPRHALSVSLVGVPYQAFYVLQARSVIDRIFFRDPDLFMLACMPPLHSLQLEMLERMHDEVRCVWTSAFARVAVVAVDDKGDALPMDDAALATTARHLFGKSPVSVMGDELFAHMRKSMETAHPIHCIALAASVLNDYVIAPNGAIEDSLAKPASLYLLSAYQHLAEARTVHRLQRFSFMDESECDDTRRVLTSLPGASGPVVAQPCIDAAAWLSIAPVSLPPGFGMHAAPVVYGERRPLLSYRLPPISLFHACRTTAKLTPYVLRNRFLPSAKIISSLQWIRNGSNGIFASAAVKKMGDEFFSVFDGSMKSIGDLCGGDRMFWLAFNWLVAIGAATAITVPPEDYIEAVHDYSPPVAMYANLWQVDADLGPTDPRAFNYKQARVVVKPMFAEEPLPPASQEMPLPSPAAGKGKATSMFAYDSDSSDDFDLGAMLASVVHDDDRVGGGAAEEEPETLLPPQTAAAAVDPILTPVAVARRCSAIAEHLREFERRALRLGRELPVMAVSRVRGFCRRGYFEDSAATRQFMAKREARKTDLINSEVVTEEEWDAYVARPDLDLRLSLSEEQKGVLESITDPDAPAVRVFQGRAGTGKTALMSIAAHAFGIEELGSCLFLANMNVNVQAWRTMLGVNGRVSTIASYLFRRDKIMVAHLKKHMAYVADRVKKGNFSDFAGGLQSFERSVSDLPLGLMDPSDVKCVFIEEAGNVSDKVMRMLFAAIQRDFPNVVRVVLFGDPDQLDPVEPGAAFAALAREHERRGLLLRVTKVFHTECPLLMHFALMVTRGKASQAFVDYVRSGCTLTGPGYTHDISADPADFTKEPVVHFSADHGLELTAIDAGPSYRSKENERAFISAVYEVMRAHDSEWIHLMAHRRAERDAMNKAARMFRAGLGSAMLPGGGLPALVSGDVAVPLVPVAGKRVAKNTPVIVLGFVSPQAQALAAFDWQRAGDSILLKNDRDYSAFWAQARHQLEGKFKSVVFVPRPQFFAAMLALVHHCEEKGVPLSTVLPHTDLSNAVKIAKGEFIPHHADLKGLLEWRWSSSLPWIDLPNRRFGPEELHIVLHDPSQWAIGNATTGAGAQGSRSPHVIIGMVGPSPFFDWRLLNVMLTRAQYTVHVVGGWTGVPEYLRNITKNRNVNRTNVLSAFLAHSDPEPAVRTLAIEAGPSTALVDPGASSSRTRPRSPTPQDDEDAKRQKRLCDDTVDSYLRRQGYATSNMDGEELIPDYTHEYRGLEVGTEVPNGGALTVNIKIGDTWYSKYTADDPGWECTVEDYMRVSHEEADALLALFPNP